MLRPNQIIEDFSANVEQGAPRRAHDEEEGPLRRVQLLQNGVNPEPSIERDEEHPRQIRHDEERNGGDARPPLGIDVVDRAQLEHEQRQHGRVEGVVEVRRDPRVEPGGHDELPVHAPDRPEHGRDGDAHREGEAGEEEVAGGLQPRRRPRFGGAGAEQVVRQGEDVEQELEPDIPMGEVLQGATHFVPGGTELLGDVDDEGLAIDTVGEIHRPSQMQ